MKNRIALLGPVESGRERKMETEGMRAVNFHCGVVFAIWLLMRSEKLHLVVACSGVVSWDAFRRVWEDGAMGSFHLNASFTHHGGNVPFQYHDRSIECTHKTFFVGPPIFLEVNVT